jgi:hypothetical protein
VGMKNARCTGCPRARGKSNRESTLAVLPQWWAELRPPEWAAIYWLKRVVTGGVALIVVRGERVIWHGGPAGLRLDLRRQG